MSHTEINPLKLQQVFARVLLERQRQQTLKAEGKFRYTCADWELGHAECALILVEEVGEVCRAVLNVKSLGIDPYSPSTEAAKLCQLQDELIQVAAVACAWLESFELEPMERIQL